MANDPETLNQLYEVLLYKKKDIIAIQKKLGISSNANQITNIEARSIDDGNPILEETLQSNKASTNISYREIYNLLLYLKKDIITI
ncbi:hypothetical protein C1646_775591 [Rhizophagus diaphanus]|nr:hypothetical protein C1646_775591 [Rhizophagus diaphanus] [Rhizophagus sp. MUCL 43196]